MRAGSLNRRVRIERRQAGQDDLGEPSETWVEFATVWGSVLMTSGKEAVLAGAEVGSATASIRVRYRTDITTGMRAVVDGVVFQILQPLPNVASREYTDLACSINSSDQL